MTIDDIPYLGLATLLRRHFAGSDLRPLGQALIARALANAEDACSLMDAAVICQFHGEMAMAMQLQQEALKLRRYYRLPAAHPPALRLLALMAPGDISNNVPIECLLDRSDIELDIYYVDAEPKPGALPEHDLLFVAITETAANRPLLDAWIPHLANWPRPILNDARRIERLGRDRAAALLADLPGVAMPITQRCPHTRLNAAALAGSLAELPGVAFPFIIRPLDSHAGHGLFKVGNFAELATALAQLPPGELFAAPFVDYRGRDGLYRKYRVILIDGKPFPCHMAVSSHWMIHYLNAGMADSAAKRAEEAVFMADFDNGFARRHAAALAGIHDRIGLDYLGIDCAETVDGRLLVFEVDHAMIVHDMDPIDLYPYKQAPMHRLFAAFRTMLFRAAGRTPPPLPC